nr:hypothetical protein [uncultured Allomuricauda sp.]
MKIKRVLFIIVAVTLPLIQLSCSSDSDQAMQDEAVELLIGEWLIESESDYFCGSDTVYREIITDPNQIYEYRSDGTWQKYTDGVEDEFQFGKWEKISTDTYTIDHQGDNVQYSVTVEFVGNDSMKFDIDECRDEDGESIYTYELYERQ